MDATTDAVAATNDTTSDRRTDRELVITRVFDGPARIVFAAWTTPELLQRWWVPKSFGVTLLSCEADVRPGGTYKFVFADPESGEPMAFVGRYLEVSPPAPSAATPSSSTSWRRCSRPSTRHGPTDATTPRRVAGASVGSRWPSQRPRGGQSGRTVRKQSEQ